VRKTFILRLGGEWRWEQAVTSGRSHETLRSFWARRPTVRDRVDRARYHWILKRASRILTTSEWFSEFLAGAFPDLRTSFLSVPNVSTIRCGTENKHRPHQPLRLLYIGRFAPVKNVLFFAKALRELARRGVNIACTFVGDGETKAECADVLRGVPNVTFAGSVQHADLQTYLDESDVFVLPSLTDICPNAVVEALSCGLPCLITKEHGLPAPLVGVIELDPQDMDAWVLAMEALTRADAYGELLRAVKPVDTSRFLQLFEAVQRV
jgi:glycosyltransferase involved in cell wall biosynthesis